MAFPSLGTARLDRMTTNILQAYTNDDFIADKILPAFPVKEESGIIPGVGNSHLRIRNNKRSLWDESSHRMDFTYENTDRYAIDYFDTDIYIPDRLRDQAMSPFSPDRDAGIIGMQNLLLERENAIAAAFSNTSVFTNYVTLTGADQYSDPSSTPLEDMETGKTSIYSKTGKEANAMVIGRKVFNTLKYHPDIVNKLRASNERISGSMLKSILAEYLDIPVENILVGKSIKISSNEGQTETKAVVWGNDIVLYRKATETAMFEPSLGYSFKMGANVRASTFRSPNNTGDIKRVELAYDDLINNADCAYLINDAVA